MAKILVQNYVLTNFKKHFHAFARYELQWPPEYSYSIFLYFSWTCIIANMQRLVSIALPIKPGPSSSNFIWIWASTMSGSACPPSWQSQFEKILATSEILCILARWGKFKVYAYAIQCCYYRILWATALLAVSFHYAYVLFRFTVIHIYTDLALPISGSSNGLAWESKRRKMSSLQVFSSPERCEGSNFLSPPDKKLNQSSRSHIYPYPFFKFQFSMQLDQIKVFWCILVENLGLFFQPVASSCARYILPDGTIDPLKMGIPRSWETWMETDWNNEHTKLDETY